MISLVITITVALLATPIETPAPPVESPITQSVLRAADYDFRYFGKDLGDESFTIARTVSGFRIEAKLALDVGDQLPSFSTYELDEQRRLVRATYRELVPGGAEAEYTISDGVLIARGTGGSARGERRIPLEPGAVVTGPHYVTDFFVLEPLALSVGARHEQTAYTFGFEGWEPTRVTLNSRRDRNKKIKGPDGRRVDTTVYSCEIVTAKKTYRTKSYLDDDGVSMKISVGAPIGTMNVSLE